MGQDTCQEAPGSTDLEGWRRAIELGWLPTFRLEAIAAAFQDLGLHTDQNVRNRLTRHLTDVIIKKLRSLVGFNHPNLGEDIIYRVHGEIFEALLDPNSKDGKALREAFIPRVSFRIKDAIAAERRNSRIPVAVTINKTLKDRTIVETVRIVPAGDPGGEANDSEADSERSPARNSNRDLTLLDGVRDLDQAIDIVRFMKVVPDERKRLAFYLYMDRVPFGSTKGYSIARALGISSKTAKEWVEEVQTLLASNEEIQELQKASLGDNT
jgi:hypothetical protein